MRTIGRVIAVVLVGLPALAGKAPSRLEVLRLLQGLRPDVKSVSDVLADLGGGRHPVLFVTRGKDCIAREIDGRRAESCSPTSAPHVAVVRRGADGALAVEATLDLPLAAPPWDVPDEMKWGIHEVKDFDRDGRPELMLTYGYHGPSYWAVGDTAYKHWCIVNLDGLTLAVHEVVNVTPLAATGTLVEARWKLLPAADGGAPAIAVTTVTGRYDEASERRVATESKKTYRYDRAADRWIAP